MHLCKLLFYQFNFLGNTNCGHGNYYTQNVVRNENYIEYRDYFNLQIQISNKTW